MIKKTIASSHIREHLSSIAPDGKEIFLLAEGGIRGTLIHGTHLVNQMRENHDLGILETLILGHAYLGAGLLTATLKGHGKVVLSVECGGPIGGFIAESDVLGNVRGYLSNVPIPVSEPIETPDLSDFFGPGFMSLTKYQFGESIPYSGQVMLRHGNIAKDLANYFLASEQIPSSFTLSIRFDRDGRVTGAGGLFLQVLPGTAGSVLEKVEEAVFTMPSLGDYFAGGGKPRRLIAESFSTMNPVHLESAPVRFECSCTKERFGVFLAMLPADEKNSILAEGPFPLRTTCHNCNSTYEFERNELQELFSN